MLLYNATIKAADLPSRIGDKMPVQQSLQDQYYSRGTCFGCGPCNVEGLQIKSYPKDKGVTATWTSSEFHGNGFGFLNGGIISTLLDCHSAACMMNETVARYGVFCVDDLEHFDDEHPVYLTNQITVTFHRPVLLSQAVELFSECLTWSERSCRYHSELRSGGKLAAEAEVLWKRFHSKR